MSNFGNCALALLLVSATYAQGQGKAKTKQATPAKQELASHEEALSYSKAFLDSLSWAKSARSRNQTKSLDNLSDLSDVMLEYKHAIQDFQLGIDSLRSFTKSKVDVIRVGSVATILTLNELVECNKSRIALLSTLANGRGPSGAGTLAEQISEIAFRTDKAWKDLMQSSVTVTYALLEPDPTNDRMRLNITEVERSGLITTLEREFGDDLKDGLHAGQLPLEASASAIYDFLSQGWATRPR